MTKADENFFIRFGKLRLNGRRGLAYKLKKSALGFHIGSKGRKVAKTFTENIPVSAWYRGSGRVAEWFKAPVLKTGRARKGPREFESHPFRHSASKFNNFHGTCDRQIQAAGWQKTKPNFYKLGVLA